MSAKTGQGFEGLTQLLDQQGNFGRKILDIDYDVYAAGEAELGWLNSSMTVSSPQAFDLDALLLEVVETLRGSLGRAEFEVAHLKAIGMHDLSFGVANLVSSTTGPELSLPSRGRVTEAEVIVNARVAADPAELERHVREAMGQIACSRGGKLEVRSLQSFRPGRPQPTHRYAAAK